MVKVLFYPCSQIEDARLKFAVILAQTDGKWVFCQHRDRDTYEVPGGHREPGETILEAAERELREETGATAFSLRPVCVYSVKRESEHHAPDETFGMLFVADIRAFEAGLHHEIKSIRITQTLVDRWTYPQIQPRLIEESYRQGWLSIPALPK